MKSHIHNKRMLKPELSSHGICSSSSRDCEDIKQSILISSTTKLAIFRSAPSANDDRSLGGLSASLSMISHKGTIRLLCPVPHQVQGRSKDGAWSCWHLAKNRPCLLLLLIAILCMPVLLMIAFILLILILDPFLRSCM